MQEGTYLKTVMLNLNDLSRFEFKENPGLSEASNLSDWIEGVDLVTEYIDGERIVKDPGLIKAEPYFTTTGFYLR